MGDGHGVLIAFGNLLTAACKAGGVERMAAQVRPSWARPPAQAPETGGRSPR
jgi:hypothetical protein